MHLDEHSDTPFYRQLEAQLREGIESGTYPTGSRLPSIRGLAADLGCARNTVEQAYHPLVQEGYVASRPARVRRAERDLPAAGCLGTLLRRAAGRAPGAKPATTSPTAT